MYAFDVDNKKSPHRNTEIEWGDPSRKFGYGYFFTLQVLIPKIA